MSSQSLPGDSAEPHEAHDVREGIEEAGAFAADNVEVTWQHIAHLTKHAQCCVPFSPKKQVLGTRSLDFLNPEVFLWDFLATGFWSTLDQVLEIPLIFLGYGLTRPSPKGTRVFPFSKRVLWLQQPFLKAPLGFAGFAFLWLSQGRLTILTLVLRDFCTPRTSN